MTARPHWFISMRPSSKTERQAVLMTQRAKLSPSRSSARGDQALPQTTASRLRPEAGHVLAGPHGARHQIGREAVSTAYSWVMRSRASRVNWSLRRGSLALDLHKLAAQMRPAERYSESGGTDRHQPSVALHRRDRLQRAQYPVGIPRDRQWMAPAPKRCARDRAAA